MVANISSHLYFKVQVASRNVARLAFAEKAFGKASPVQFLSSTVFCKGKEAMPGNGVLLGSLNLRWSESGSRRLDFNG